jgi:hypothetical protein
MFEFEAPVGLKFAPGGTAFAAEIAVVSLEKTDDFLDSLVENPDAFAFTDGADGDYHFTVYLL